MSTEAKPCPWCGGTAHLHEWYFGAFVVCWKCKAQGPPTSDTGTREGNAARAWELWEKRVESQNATAPLDEGGAFYKGIEWFACWLLDNVEGETITEEQLRPWAVKAWSAAQCSPNAPRVSHGGPQVSDNYPTTDNGTPLAGRPGSADELELAHMNIYWIHYPASSLGSFYRCETHRGFTGPEDAMILVVTIFKEDNTWLVCLEDTLNSDEFQAVHHKLQEILANDLRPY